MVASGTCHPDFQGVFSASTIWRKHTDCGITSNRRRARVDARMNSLVMDYSTGEYCSYVLLAQMLERRVLRIKYTTVFDQTPFTSPGSMHGYDQLEFQQLQQPGTSQQA